MKPLYTLIEAPKAPWVRGFIPFRDGLEPVSQPGIPPYTTPSTPLPKGVAVPDNEMQKMGETSRF
ncbi:hypothetical protein EG347_11010 [Chryseobacterium sp. G0186]|nr:hypothetical protein EG347_11010 [Chryseobacterium sp. G0186]